MPYLGTVSSIPAVSAAPSCTDRGPFTPGVCGVTQGRSGGRWAGLWKDPDPTVLSQELPMGKVLCCGCGMAARDGHRVGTARQSRASSSLGTQGREERPSPASGDPQHAPTFPSLFLKMQQIKHYRYFKN